MEPPAGFPESLPGPPPGVPLQQTQLTERALVDQAGTQQGTVVHRVVRFEVGTGRDEDVATVLAYYRGALPDAGWTVDADEELEADPDQGREHPGWRLRVSGHGYEQVTVNAQQRHDVVMVSVGVLETIRDRAPYWTHPPLIPLPGWFAALAELPEGAIRERIEITETVDEPTRATIAFHIGDGADLGRNRGLLDATADHYRTALATAGWSVADETAESERRDLGQGVELHTERRVLELEGDGGVRGQVSASQPAYSFEDHPRPVRVTVRATTSG